MLGRLRRLLTPKPVFDGDHSQRFWTVRDDSDPSYEAYWATRNNLARNAVGAAIAALPGDSLLEVGVHAGANLWAAAQRKDFARLAGTELSPTVLAYASTTLPAALGRPVELVQAAADRLPFPDKSFDVVLSSVMLVCIGPEAILASLSELVRVCRGHLVLAEPFSDSPSEATPGGRLDIYPNTTYWIRNYPGLLAGLADLVSVQKLPPEVNMGHLDSITVLKVL